jgi:hypothetical protein
MDPAIEQALTGGSRTAAELCEAAGVSQATLSRWLAEERARVAVLGRGRATRYALRRKVRDLPPELPVYRVSMSGDGEPIGTIGTLEPDRYWYQDGEHPRRSSEFHSLPWFMTDMRPQGYLGRFFPQRFADLGLPPRITDWTEDQALYAIARRGEDAPGNLVIGDESYARWLASPRSATAVPEDERLRRYASLAAEVVAGRGPGSSAAGEQPKFGVAVETSTRGIRHALVKFTAPHGSASAQRWADLLFAEHLAARVLHEHAHAAVQSEYLRDGTRAYLEVRRFDRIGARGRLGVVSLGALDDEFVGARQGWPESAAALLRAGLIGEGDARELRFLSAFGRLIANTDMHFGNASFLVRGARDLALAPAYDMLPMFYAPVADELPDREYPLPVPLPGHADQWREAVPLAQEFWERLAAEAQVSEAFRATAAANARQMAG